MSRDVTSHPKDANLSWEVAAKWALTVALVAAALFLLRDHEKHLFSALPYILLLACPLLHLFGHHHGHGHDKGKGDRSN